MITSQSANPTAMAIAILRIQSGMLESFERAPATRLHCGRAEGQAFNRLRSPEVAVKAAILDRLTDVLRFNIRSFGQICNSAGDFEDAVVGASGESKLRDGHFQ